MNELSVITVTHGDLEVTRYEEGFTATRAMGDLIERCRQQEFQGQDLAVWNDEKLIAVISQEPDQGPSYTLIGTGWPTDWPLSSN